MPIQPPYGYAIDSAQFANGYTYLPKMIDYSDVREQPGFEARVHAIGSMSDEYVDHNLGRNEVYTPQVCLFPMAVTGRLVKVSHSPLEQRLRRQQTEGRES